MKDSNYLVRYRTSEEDNEPSYRIAFCHAQTKSDAVRLTHEHVKGVQDITVLGEGDLIQYLDSEGALCAGRIAEGVGGFAESSIPFVLVHPEKSPDSVYVAAGYHTMFAWKDRQAAHAFHREYPVSTTHEIIMHEYRRWIGEKRAAGGRAE